MFSEIQKCSFSLVLVSFVIETASATDLAAIERQIISRREALENAVFRVTSRVGIESGKREGTARSLDATVYFNDADTIRMDKKETRPTLGDGDQAEESAPYERKLARTGGQILSYCNKVFNTGVTVMPELYNRDDVDGQLFFITDPRLVGLWPSGYLNLAHQNMHTLFRKDAWSVEPGSITEVVVDGTTLINATYNSKSGVTARVTLIEFKDGEYDVKAMNVVDGEYSWDIITEYTDVPGYGPFPSSVDFTGRRGNTITRTEALEINVVSVGEPNPASVFSFAGMGVPMGTIIADHTGESLQDLELTDDGLKPVSEASSSREAELTAEGDQKSWRSQSTPQ